jgi:hypothetical protein
MVGNSDNWDTIRQKKVLPSGKAAGMPTPFLRKSSGFLGDFAGFCRFFRHHCLI